MISDQQLDEYRQHGTKVRVIRDIHPMNDVIGIVVAWNDESVLIRKINRKVIDLSRDYQYQTLEQDR